MSSSSSILQPFLNKVFTYETPKIVSVKSQWVGFINRLLQILILLYIGGYVLMYKKGYQEFKGADSAVSHKVKGSYLTNISQEYFQIPETFTHLYNRLWDPPEHSIIPLSGQVFYFMTNVIITPNQTLGKCDSDPNDFKVRCGEGLPACKTGAKRFYGELTGNCIPSTYEPEVHVCEVEGWCPVEQNIGALKNNTPVLKGAENFTVFIRNTIHFRHFGPKYRRNNILSHTTSSYLKTCQYDEKTDPLCPIFTLKYMLEQAGENFSEVAYTGAIMGITITWDCDLDYNFDKYCIPKYNFRRVDNSIFNQFEGWNFRHTYHHEFDRRTLLKIYGVKFSVEVQAQGHKFAYMSLFMNIGAGLALMGLAAAVCDILLLIHDYKELIKGKKDKKRKAKDDDCDMNDEESEEDEKSSALALTHVAQTSRSKLENEDTVKQQ